jgi:Ca-activated chloride channel family protein
MLFIEKNIVNVVVIDLPKTERQSLPISIIRDYFSILFMAIFLFIYSSTTFSQEEKKFIHEGNKQYENKNYSDAEKNYSRALNKNKNSYKGSFNLGDSYYKQGKYNEAAEQFQSLTHTATSKDTLSKAYHNLGNALLKSKKYQECVDAYKNALKNNPNDDDTRYNLSYAQQMLRQQQQQQKKNQDKKDDKKNNKDKKDQDKKDKDKKDQDKKDKQDKDKQNQDKQKQQQNQISKDDAQRLLDALQNDEKNLQDKMKKAKVKGAKTEIDKDW